MDKNKFVELLTAKLREKAAKNHWRLDDIQFAINSVKEATDNISQVTEESDGYQIHYLAGSNVPKNIGHLYHIHNYLKVPVYTRMNGVIARVESVE
jgi:hypothetical protein